MIAAGVSSPTGRWIRNNLRFVKCFFSRGERAPVQGGRPRVVLLSGWSLTPGTVSLLARRLDADGFQAEVFPLEGLFGKLNTLSVEMSAERLLDHLRASQRPDERVAIIGHSLGGVIGRYLVSVLGGDRFVHTLITLASPHRGAPMARLARLTPLRWISKSVVELRPESDFMRGLNSKPIPQSVYCVSLFSETDDLCPPPCAEVEILDGADNVLNINVGAYGHFELAVDDAVYSRIKRELVRGIERHRNLPPRCK